MPSAGIILVSSDAHLEELLTETLKEVQTLVRVPPALQSLKEALHHRPALAIFHISGTGLDERRRMKTLVEVAASKAPILLLGTQVDGATLFELSSEWKASSAIVWSPQRATFLQRLVQGIIRRHMEGGEGPMAPAEDET